MSEPIEKLKLRIEWPPTVAVREVIEVQFRRGEGVPDDPVRIVTAYHDLQGNLLAENDSTVAATAAERIGEGVAGEVMG